MKNSYTSLFILCLSYIAVFSLGSLTSRWYLSCLIELIALLLPFVLARRVSVCSLSPVDPDIGFSPRPVGRTLWLLPPFLGAVILLSLASGFIANRLGYPAVYNYGDSVLICILSSALLPAVTEELFCRYIFLPRLSVYSRSGAVIASALFFAFLHGNFFQMPYAFLAGLFLGALAVGCGSVIPGVLFHCINNTVSILLHFYADTSLPRILLYVLFGTLAVSLICGILFRRRLWDRLRLVFRRDENTGAVVRGLFLSPLAVLLLLFVVEACLRLKGNV